MDTKNVWLVTGASKGLGLPRIKIRPEHWDNPGNKSKPKKLSSKSITRPWN
ncbi:hypothetical protein CLV42_104586 [Chitinophaga ginsengisoli]|uniref:Uncharacterized protein n=1 Tax=Chitinophaga ginsengisoli TaxID=363837 RepID=A0A2P8GE74_9BACT|nr:hypothetical protein CLV42_104586 [Chitinophaga ginsengisoli]